jgi:hypothetical protein
MMIDDDENEYIKSDGVVVTDTDSNDSVINCKRFTFSRICFDFSFITK